MAERLLILHQRAARRRARVVAEAEAGALLRGLEPRVRSGGPLAERGGLIWVGIEDAALEEASRRLPMLGYCDAVDLLEPIGGPGTARSRLGAGPTQIVRWRGRDHRLVRLYEEDAEEAREAAPDRRRFMLATDGAVRPVVGYRGDGGPLGRRGLPVADARLLVNLVFAPARGRFLDPFAGIGGVAIEALAAGWRVVTVDVDPVLRFGLAAFGTSHVVANARRLPFPDRSIAAIATEPPYDREAAGAVRGGFRESLRVLSDGGRLAMLVAEWQQEILFEEAARLGLAPELACPIDRKGLPVVVMVWARA
jgi:hypothetical protein